MRLKGSMQTILRRNYRMNTIVARMPGKKAVPPEENARIVAGTLEGESEIRAGLGPDQR